MTFVKGAPRPARAGRKRGTPNKTTVSVKQALTEAFDLRGGVPALLKWAKKNPREFYGLWGRMLPLEHNVTGVNPLADMLRAAEERLARPE